MKDCYINSLSLASPDHTGVSTQKMAGNKAVFMLITMVMVILKVEGSRQSDVEEILAQASKLQTAYGARDMETFTKLYTDDCRLYIPGFPPAIGRDGTSSLVT